MLAVSAAYGGMSSLLSIAVADRAAVVGTALAVSAGAMLVGRYGSGVIADRTAAGRTLVPALLVGAAGLAALAWAVAGVGGDAGLIAGATAFGLAFGAVQNESLLALLDSAGPERVGAASAAWNIAYDGGTGIGSLALGLVAGAAGYPAVFWLAAIVVLAVTPVVVWPRAVAAASPESGTQ